MSDADGAISRLYGVKTPIIKIAKRTTFVVGKDRKILHVETGGDAVDGSGAAEACSLF